MKGVKPPATSPFSQYQLRFNEDSCSDKRSEVGFNYFYAGGLLGAIGAAVLVPQWRPILIVNTSGNVEYVTFGDSSVVAPVDGSDGIPLAANGGYIVLSSGINTHIIASSAAVFAYAANDNVVDVPEDDLHG